VDPVNGILHKFKLEKGIGVGTVGGVGLGKSWERMAMWVKAKMITAIRIMDVILMKSVRFEGLGLPNIERNSLGTATPSGG
jgi:hypothetical protein